MSRSPSAWRGTSPGGPPSRPRWPRTSTGSIAIAPALPGSKNFSNMRRAAAGNRVQYEPIEEVMDLHPPPAFVQTAQAEAPPEEAPAEPTPIRVDVSRYIPSSAIFVTMLVTVTPPTGAAFIYTPGAEN